MKGIISEPKEILDQLVASQEQGNAIGIWAPSLGGGLHMCQVENIYDDDIEHDEVIVLKQNDLNGEKLQTHVLFLQEIEKVFSISTHKREPIRNTR